MSARKPLEAVYVDAADLIDRNGWYVGDYFDPAGVVVGDRPPLCAAGAVILAAGTSAPDEWRAGAVALCGFACFLTDRGDIDPAMIAADCPEDAIDAIGAWNDACASADEVTAALRAAADVAATAADRQEAGR